MKAVVLWLAMNTSKEVNRKNYCIFQYSLSDTDTFLLTLLIVSLDLKSKVI